jgi:branched-chain amino acid transport system substrate-binding protein
MVSLGGASMRYSCAVMLSLLLPLSAISARSEEVVIGMSGTYTGPNAAIGAGYRMAAEIFPTMIAGVTVRWVVIDDGGDATTAVKNARRFVDEDRADAIFGSNSPPPATAMIDVAFESKTPQLTLAPVAIPGAKGDWTFNVPHVAPAMVVPIVEDMKARNFKTVGYIGFADVWGDQNWNALNKLAEQASIKVVGGERYNRTDTTVTAQVLKIMEVKPDCIFIGAGATPAALPHLALREQGYTGQIYHTFAAVTKPFLQAGGKMLDGSRVPTGPLIVAANLEDRNPIKAVALDFTNRFEARHGKGTVTGFAGYAWDAMLILSAALPDALKKARPGTPEFRSALRDSLASGREVVGTQGIYTFTQADHYGGDARSSVMLTVKDSAFRYIN